MARVKHTTAARDVQAQAVYRYLAAQGIFSSTFLARLMSSNYFVSSDFGIMSMLRREHEISIRDLAYDECGLLYRMCYDERHEPKAFTGELFSLLSSSPLTQVNHDA